MIKGKISKHEMLSAKWIGWVSLCTLFLIGLGLKAQHLGYEDYFREDVNPTNFENWADIRSQQFLSISKATDWQWLNWGKISRSQLQSIREYEKTFGKVNKLYQLNAIEGFDSLTIDRIASLADSSIYEVGSKTQIGLLFPKNFALVRHGIPENNRFPWSQFRIRYQTSNYRLGLNWGSVWFPIQNQQLRTSFQTQLFTGFIEGKISPNWKLTFGSQSIRTGLGLVNGGAYRPNSSFRLADNFLGPSGIIGSASNNSQWTPQGFGLEYTSQKYQIILFAGKQNQPISSFRNQSNSQSIRSINWKDPASFSSTDTFTKTYTQALYLARTLGNGFSLGGGITSQNYNRPLLPEGYNSTYSFYQNSRYTNSTIDLKKTFGKWIFNIEWAWANNKNRAFQAYASIAISRKLNLQVNYRRAGRWYIAPLGRAYTQNTRVGNEEGLWFNLNGRWKAIDFMIVTEFYRLSPTYYPSNYNTWNHEHLAQITRRSSKGWESYIRVRIRNNKYQSDAIDISFPSQWVLGFKSTENSIFSFAINGQLSTEVEEKQPSYGLWQDLVFRFYNLELLNRIGFFNANKSPLYRFEPGLLYLPQTAIFSTNGWQNLTRIRYRFKSAFTFEMRANFRTDKQPDYSFQLTAKLP